MNRLTKEQRELIISWVAEGLQSDEIKTRAAVCDPPFTASARVITYYRKQSNVNLPKLIEQGKLEALTTGLALPEERVRRLSALAERLEADVMNGRLWVDTVKAVGKEAVWVEEFNAAEVAQYRGLLDDIAKEVGGRQIKVDQTQRVEIKWNWEPPTSNI